MRRRVAILWVKGDSTRLSLASPAISMHMAFRMRSSTAPRCWRTVIRDSAPHRLKDLADVQELIKIKKLDAHFANKLDPYVRAKYLELQDAVSKSELIQEK